MEMGSRRTMSRSLSGNGSFPNGTEVSGSGRSPGCSYLSNVRPETRSTLCSVIAQLTEETQPFFEVTLKSKAVSESCNVKFFCVVTGYPTPQVTWYKDDVQLDRYCGLPKYEVFRNGQNHSLHIYNCTVEDAAIYQASAINSKGIVSCSGVLEVGEMNEFRIHQRYFSKLKQKAENKRREAEEKENQEPARTISPDRAQRKRRSTVGGYISAPCSTEEDTSERSQQEAPVEVKARVQESNVEKVKDSNGTMESMELHSSTGQEAKDSSSTPGPTKYDAAQKVFTALQPKTFFKKFKISNPKVGPEEKKSSVESLPQSQKTAEGSMEVEGSVTTTSVLPPFKSLKRRVPSVSVKQGSGQEKVDRKTATGNVKVQNGSPSNNSSPVIPPRASKQQQSQPKIKEDMNKSPKARDRDTKAKCLPRDTDTSCDSGTALPQPPSQQARHDPPQKETRPAQKEECVPERGLKREATQALAKAQRNEPLVDLELPAKLHSTVAPEETPTERPERDRRGPSLHRGPHKTADKTIQNTQDHSRISDGLCSETLSDAQKASLESQRAGENTSECNVSPAVQQSQLNTPIKTVEGIEIQPDEKVKCYETGTSIAQSTGVAPNEVGAIEIAQEKAGDVNTKHDNTIMDLSNKEKESKRSVETVTVSSRGKDTVPITNTFSEPLSKDFRKCPSPIPNILSIAELLRSQINALEESVLKDRAENHSGRKVESDSNSAKKTNKDTCIEKSPPQSIKETLMQIYNELIKTKELFEDEASTFSYCVQSPKSSEIPPIDTPEKTLLSTDVNKQTSKTCLSETALPQKVNGQEGPKNDSVQKDDIGAKNKQTPEITLNNDSVEDREIITEPLICNGKTQEHQLNISSSEPVHGLSVQSVFENENNSQKESPVNGDSVIADVTPYTILETSPSLKKRDSVSIPSATPQELASGARRKIPSHKTKLDEPGPSTPNNDLNPSAVAVSSSPRPSRHSLLLSGPEEASPKRKPSPLLSRKKSPVEALSQETQELSDPKSEESPADKVKNDPYKAPQVIRKIRGETFSDHSGNMKLWCQFFNVLSESTVTWHKDELTIAKMLKGAGDETQVSLALAQATSRDTGVYGCTITNEYGTDSTDFLLSAEVLAGLSLREDLGVGEEIELTPLLFNKGVADSVWGNKLFGRVMVQESHLGVGFSHKTWRAKVIYGLEPVFESGNTCILKICNPIAYGGKGESLLIEKNQEVVKQACKIQNLAREYCKIFSAEARAAESFGFSLEVIPVYLVYRPACSIPYATLEADLMGVYSRHCGLDLTGRLDIRSTTEVEQKCCALQHWIFQWTSGNMLFTKLEGVDSKITNVGISVKSPGHQGLSIEGNPKVFEQFVIQHQCNYFCGLLGLRSLKVIESLLIPTKPKGSKSPLLQRKTSSGLSSPQTGRKMSASPRTSRKVEQDGRKTPSQAEHRIGDESKDKMSITQ